MLYKSKTVLYVDDADEQRYAMRRILESAGYEVLEANTGAEALRLLKPDLTAVILDVRLPDMNGYDVCRAIKMSSVGAAIPVLQISASFVEPSLRAEALSGGADSYIAQPVHPQELLNLLQATIHAHRSERMLRLLASVGLRIAGSLDLEATIRSATESVVPIFCDHCSLYLSQSPELKPPDTSIDEVAADVIQSGKPELLQLQSHERSVIAVPLDVPTGRLGAAAFIVDVSGRRYTAEDVPLAQDLAMRIALAIQNAQLHTEQQAAQAALIQSEKIAAAGRLAAAIAHEINNPLEAVVNLVYLMEMSADSPGEVRKYAHEALSELSRLSHIARQTLGFYRELVGPQEFDLSQSVKETLSLLKKRINAKSILLHENYAPSLSIYAVKGEIRQVISNLILNAVEAMEPGGSLTLETYLSSDGYAIARVKDTGRGMAAGVLSRMFEPFFTTKEGTGTGLGLWVSKRIVHKHGGEIHVHSETGENHGTTVEIALKPRPVLS